MKKTLFIIISLLLSISSYSQNNYKKGYIITNENDTIFGQIDFRTDQINNKQCRFKASDSNKDITYYPSDIMGYRFIDEGKFYISHDIEINGSKEKVFLEFMVQGMMNLYSYFDQQQYFFFENSDGSMNMITKNPDKIEGSKVVTDTKYKGTLFQLFKDHGSLLENAEQSDFSQKSMINITKMYHDKVCTSGEECIVFENPNPDKSGIKIKISAYIGLQHFFYKFYNKQKDELNSSKCINPTIGGQINFSNPRWSNSFSLLLDISISKFKKDNEKFLAIRNTDQLTKVYNYKGYILSPQIGIKYSYPKYRLRPVLEAGFSSAFLVGTSCNVTYEFQSIDTSSLSHRHDMKSRCFGFFASAGIDYNITKDQFAFIRVSYEGYLQQDATSKGGEDKFQTSQIKLGYSF